MMVEAEIQANSVKLRNISIYDIWLVPVRYISRYFFYFLSYRQGRKLQLQPGETKK